MNVIIDTNVPIVANNRDAPQASAQCAVRCAQRLQKTQDEDILVLDDNWLILREYMDNLRSQGQPGLGDAFLKWVLTNKHNPHCCQLVSLTPQGDSFVEFPDDPALEEFDISDRKFAAIAHAHGEHPHVLNATDSDWWHFRAALEHHDIHVDFICPDYEFKQP
jgi:hypothetical protein